MPSGRCRTALTVIRRAVEGLAKRTGSLAQTSGRALAEVLRVPVASVCRWIATTIAGEHVAPPGRPPKPADDDVREQVREAVRASAGKLAIRQLRERFPTLARRVLRDERAAIRKQLRREQRQALYTVGWRRIGAVWAMDHTELEGAAALCVRDLASDKVLHPRLGPDVGADHVVQVLRQLFEEHGPPLVLKSDNGSGFIATAVRDLLAAWRVLPLYSPARTPQYNGGIESTCRWVKQTAVDLAILHGGAPGDWLEEAGRILNAQHKRRLGGTPDELWARRTPITQAERDKLHRIVARNRDRILRDQGIAPDTALPHAQASAVDRRAITAALFDHGALRIQRP